MMFSVIIPVYNTKTFLRRCVDSVLSQDYSDFEVLIVDDGSDDGSESICDEYGACDKRVRIFHKSNGGISSARNVGLKEAKGDYIIWVDSDDWVEEGMFSSLARVVDEELPDIVIYGHRWVGVTWKGSSWNEERVLKHYPTKEGLLEYVLTSAVGGALWYKMAKTEMYLGNGIFFIDGADMAEDMTCSVRLIDASGVISYVDDVFYNYNRENFNSITVYKNVENVLKMTYCSLTNFSLLIDLLKKYDLRLPTIHSKLVSIAPLLEIEDEFLLKKWCELCDVSVWDIVRDCYYPKGYRLKYFCAKVGLYGLYRKYVLLKSKYKK